MNSIKKLKKLIDEKICAQGFPGACRVAHFFEIGRAPVEQARHLGCPLGLIVVVRMVHALAHFVLIQPAQFPVELGLPGVVGNPFIP